MAPVTPPLDNPAGRLYRVLAKVKSAKETEQIGLVLGRLFDLADGVDGASLLLGQAPEPDILLQVAKLAMLAREAREQIQAIDNINHELLLRWVTNIDRALPWAGRWNEHVNNYATTYS